MKVKFICDSGANIHSARKETVDTVSDLGLEEGEWEKLTEEEKFSMVKEWADERLEIYWDDES